MRDALNASPRKGTRASRLAIWSAGIAIALILASGLGAALGALPPFGSMGAYALGSLAALVAAVAGITGLVRSGGTAGSASRPATWLAVLAAVGITANNGVVMGGARGAPPIHDISTDTTSPPAFVALLNSRDGAQNPPEYAGAETAAQQRQAFPDLAPLQVSAAPGTVFAAATAVVAAQGWTLVEASEADGRIEATAETRWVRFKDDVVIRIVPDGTGQTVVDVRSKSRIGRGDMGQNAKRVREFLAALRAQLAGG
jgi:uncharacterized protein (DUF1499 family)